MFYNVFHKSEKKTCFYVFLNLQINVFNIYGQSVDSKCVKIPLPSEPLNKSRSNLASIPST